MEEYLSYSLSPQGQLYPVVSIVNPLASFNDSKPVYRDLGREDLLRIPDEKNIPGGWLYKRGTASSTTSTLNAWTRRFAILRGSYLFFFHNPQSDKPLFLIPLSGCEVILPPNDAKAFDDSAQRRVFKANDGYEFEIRPKNNKYPPIRLYSLFEQERDEWVSFIQDRSFEYDDIAHEINSQDDDDGRISENAPSGGMVVITKTKLIGDSPVAADQINTAEINAKRLFSDAAAARAPMTTLAGNIATYSPFSNPTPGATETKEELVVQRRVSTSIHELMPDATEEKPEVTDEEEKQIDNETLDRIMIKRDAKTRQMEARERASSRQSIDAARLVESNNPMTLAEMFRILLYFIKEELVEEPRPEVASQIPHLKGEWSENLVITIYQYYCGDNGFMNLEQFIEFMDDSGILQTHASRDDNDEPNAEYERQLDPAELMTTIPPDLGNAVSQQMEPLSINFFMFYHMILRIARIVYREIAEENEAHAMNKLIYESLCPLYGWCKGHCKRGSTDILVLEDRIPLLMLTYAPNLWRVFLLYAQDVVGKTQDLTAVFPEEAQANEKGMHGLPPGVPFHAKVKAQESLFLTESQAVRFATDYALCPHLISRADARKIFGNTNREKNLISTKLSVRDQAPTNAALLRLEAVHERLTRFRETSNISAMFGFFPEGALSPNSPNRKTADASVLRVTGSSQAINNINQKGLSFSEFIEFICRIALLGLEHENYSILFPTPFSKILAMLTVWGVADLKKVEELRVLQSTKAV